ncbi:MAG: hypothetical protein BWY85_00020 [Firmicutes bacterium ADurb.Bin506]|nr:MAG: hypothetical protein BWY85_00020 [Firmicutes bacterium ADurb.Bin506]
MSTTTTLLAPWKADLQKAFDSDLTSDSTLRWLGIPTVRDFPTPGDARLWTSREWGNWCKTRGYDEGRQTTQAVIFTHKAHPKFTVGASRTNGDPRAAMNCAADSRRTVILYSRELDVRLRSALDELPDDEEAAKAIVAGWDLSENRPAGTHAHAHTVAGDSAYKIIQEIARDQKISMTKVVENSLGKAEDGTPAPADYAQNFVDKAKAGVPIPKTLYDLILEYRRNLAAEEAILRDERRAQREARAFKPAIKSPREVVGDLVGQIQKSRRQELDGVIAALNSAMDRARLAREGLDTHPPVIPDLSDAEKDARIADLEKDLAQAELERDANATEAARVKELLITAQAANQTSSQQEHRLTFAKLILELVTGTDFSNLAANLKALKEAAQDEIKDASK